MSTFLWCGLLDNKKRPNKIQLDYVKCSCERFQTYCSFIESFCKLLSFIEISFSIIIFIWSCFRCNPILLKLIIGSKSIRLQQPSLQPVFVTAKYLRGSSSLSVYQHIPTLLFNIICYINIIILTIDILYSIYLWIKIRKEVLFLHYGSKDIASVEIRNIMISLAVTPMSAFCVSRYSYFNKYIASSKLSDALENVHLIIKSDNNQRTDNIELEKEAIYILDTHLTKTKPFDMKDMEDVLELIVPTFLLWNLNIYLLYSGFIYLYIYIVLFIIIMILIIWFKFSSNIGMITPLLLPLTCLFLEFWSFIFMSVINLLWYKQNIYAVLLCAPLLFASVTTLFWKRKGLKQQ